MIKKIALVTGANRGIGFEVCRQLCNNGHKVILTARNKEKGKIAQQKLCDEKLDVDLDFMDIADLKSIEQVVNSVKEKFGRLDILINNAAIASDAKYSILDVDIDIFKNILETNVLGALYLSQLCIPLMKKNNYGRIVNVSSGRGSFSRLTEGKPGGPAYRISKTAMNACTCLLADAVKDFNILVNAVTPGWVKTKMGGFDAPLSVAEGAETIVWLANLSDNGPRGCFFKDKKEFPW